LLFYYKKRKGKAKSIFQVLAFDKNICFSIFIKKKNKKQKNVCAYKFRLNNKSIKSIKTWPIGPTYQKKLKTHVSFLKKQ
jgi:hypothetical protein